MVVLRRGGGKNGLKNLFLDQLLFQQWPLGGALPRRSQLRQVEIKTKKRQEIWCFLSKLKQTITGFEYKFREIV